MANIKYTDIEAEEHAKEVGVPPRPKETKNEIDERGAFVRQPNSFIVPFGEKEGAWKAEAGRYRIYWAKGCNWSNRPVIARDLLGLKEVSHPDELFLRHPQEETPEEYQSDISFCGWNRESQKDREPSDAKNSPLDEDASINPLKGKIDA